jgi:hypothetical protein
MDKTSVVAPNPRSCGVTYLMAIYVVKWKVYFRFSFVAFLSNPTILFDRKFEYYVE